MASLRLSVPVTIKIEGGNLKMAQGWLNTLLYGAEEIPMDATVPLDLVNAHYALNSTYITHVDVDVFEDGRKQVVRHD